MDKIKEMGLNKQLALGGGVVLLISMLIFDWFKASSKNLDVGGFDIGGRDLGVSAKATDLDFIWGTLPLLLTLALIAYVAVVTFAPQVELPEAPWALIALIVGGLAGGLVILKTLIGESGNEFVDISRQFGIFISALAAAAMIAGVVMDFLEEQKSGGGASSGGSTPPPPPAPPTS